MSPFLNKACNILQLSHHHPQLLVVRIDQRNIQPFKPPVTYIPLPATVGPWRIGAELGSFRSVEHLDPVLAVLHHPRHRSAASPRDIRSEWKSRPPGGELLTSHAESTEIRTCPSITEPAYAFAPAFARLRLRLSELHVGTGAGEAPSRWHLLDLEPLLQLPLATRTAS